MTESYDLTQLDPNSFEHLVNLLALRVLGLGHTGFGPGPDGGRDGYYEGEAPYPSKSDRWSGRWYIQSKFHKPHLSKDPQKWLLDRIQEELKEFKNPESKRQWPDNWIIATNIDPSGTPMTGAFDEAKKLVSQARPKLKNRFHIWGGRKILDLLVLYPEAADYYKHFLTPGSVLTAMYDQIKDARAEIESILRFLIVKQFDEQQYTKLEQAGSAADMRPGIHRLFIDLPFRADEYKLDGLVTEFLVRTASRCHRIDQKQPDTKEWRFWQRHPSRARVWFLKGGPGQGKSTIGQFFCQIQRAALILQKDGPRVLPGQKTLAIEVRKVAYKAGFWPSVPRIPVLIELKGYAYWFGQRDDRSPHGILTYLAEKISASLEQEVLVGTLKRALRSRSWFFVFDGLDEVPQDVKDAVASEVRNFLDNVVVENDIDLLTLCTSRPQGYSGQFSELDGPTIDLVDLSTDQALNCTKPVLELGRSESEAQKALGILTSAMQSSSVRELMTTPLQAHIMAVVVRDGGRPPDRRWQLFTNFYQVIKRREANRNLPDRKLAKLLREDEQLLKAVHNRLGFVLHARAETSKGAQTHLDRNEFKALVAEAASQMIENDVKDTVDVLMEATTERLVLVNTPDDGNHLRFDIRPLQEFFAAEFIYESIDAELLRHRMELIAGDSHWREVMHFLLSALVENGRRTELSVAVEVLEHLNEGDGDPQSRLLRRRLGRGALLASRLIQEGVLEQDKRIRQQFRKCLEPLAAFTDVKALQPVISVVQPNSHTWLINFLVETLQEASPSESVGAAIVLSQILPDGSDKEEEVQNFFLSAPPEYMSVVLVSSLPRTEFEEKRKEVKNWFLKIVLKLLLGPRWASLTIEAIRAAIISLRYNKEHSCTLARENGLSNNQVEMLRSVLSERTDNQKQKPIQQGFITGSYFQHDWTTGTFAFGSWDDKLPDELSSAPGILQPVYLALRFGETRELSDLVLLLNYLKQGKEELFTILPDHIRAYIPIDMYLPIQDQIKNLSSITKRQFRTLLQNGQIGAYCLYRPMNNLALNNKYDLRKWMTTIEQIPYLALHLWCDSFWEPPRGRKRPEILDRPQAINALVDKVIKLPALLADHPYLWGKLLEKAPNREAELRHAFRIASLVISDKGFWFEEFHTFKLHLPEDAFLLPILLNAVIEASSSLFRNVDNEKKLAGLGRLIQEFVSDISLLERIISDSTLPESTRAAAVLMSLLHPSGSRELERKQRLLVTFYRPNRNRWYLKAITVCLTLLTTEKDEAASWVMGSLLDQARIDYIGREELQQLLAVWRETSHAPVQSAKVLTRWLAGT